jgi:site-specific DNA recombinase
MVSVSPDVDREGGEHKRIVDQVLFDRVQQILFGHAQSGDRSHKHEHYLKGSVYCGNCGSRLIFTENRGNGGVYAYFKCFSRHNLRSGCAAPHTSVARIERAVEQCYLDERWLTPEETSKVCRWVDEYGEKQAGAARSEADRAAKRLDALKAEQS